MKLKKSIFIISVALVGILCGCTAKPEKTMFFGIDNVIQPDPSFSDMDSEQYYDFQQEIKDLFVTTFSENELIVLQNSSKDPILTSLREKAIEDYSEQNMDVYTKAFEEYVGQNIFSKLTDKVFLNHYTNILSEYRLKMIKRDKERMNTASSFEE